ncbi:hypothetical protein EMCRGX_G012858 [Ephydatia muelleri]
MSSVPEESQRRLQTTLQGLDGEEVDVLVYGSGAMEEKATPALGVTILQEGRPVTSVSRSLTKSKRNYVALELECLAVVFACQKFDQYIYGKRVTVETDHTPLEVIIKKSLLAAPGRLQRMLLQLPRCHLGLKDAIVQELKVISEREFTSISDLRLATVKVAAKDGEQTVLWRVLVDGWPHKLADVPEHARKYWNLRDTVTKQDGVIYKSGQVVVPSSLREIFALSAFKSSRSRVYFPANLRCGIPARGCANVSSETKSLLLTAKENCSVIVIDGSQLPDPGPSCIQKDQPSCSHTDTPEPSLVPRPLFPELRMDYITATRSGDVIHPQLRE